MSLRKAINDKCRECLYDPLANGNWRQQITACTSACCPLYPYRPTSKPKGYAKGAISGAEINEQGMGQGETGAGVNLPERHQISCPAGSKTIGEQQP